MNVRTETVDIVVDERRIEGTLTAPPAGAADGPGVLFVHGWGANRDYYIEEARALAGIGCVCLTFNLRGHAETEALHETVTLKQWNVWALVLTLTQRAVPWVEPCNGHGPRCWPA